MLWRACGLRHRRSSCAVRSTPALAHTLHGCNMFRCSSCFAPRLAGPPARFLCRPVPHGAAALERGAPHSPRASPLRVGQPDWARRQRTLLRGCRALPAACSRFCAGAAPRLRCPHTRPPRPWNRLGPFAHARHRRHAALRDRGRCHAVGARCVATLPLPSLAREARARVAGAPRGRWTSPRQRISRLRGM